MGGNGILSRYIHNSIDEIGDAVNVAQEYETGVPITSSILKRGIEGKSKELQKHKKRLTNANIIKNISFDQSEILWNIMQLYNDGKPYECDMTASELKFYGEGRGKYNIPVIQGGKYLGYISRANVFSAYRKMMSEISED